MNLLFRNFWNTLRRYKVASVLNILGLSIAFAAFAVIMMQVRYDLSFDKFHEKYDRIYRIEMWDTDYNRFGATFPRPALEEIKHAFPEAQVLPIWYDIGETYVKTDPDDREYSFRELLTDINSDFLEAFDLPVRQGDISRFSQPNQVVISETLAEKFYPGRDAVGKELILMDLDSVRYEIAAVYRDLPRNSGFKNGIYRQIGDKFMDEEYNWSCYGYVLLSTPEQKEILTAKLDGFFRKYDSVKELDRQIVRLNSLNDIHFSNDVEWDKIEKGNRSTVYTLLLIAILVIVIAAVNFINFSTALIPARIRTINTQRVLGVSQSGLRKSMVFEAVGISLIAAGLALWIIYVLSLSSFSSLIDAELSFRTNGVILAGMVLISLVTGLIAGIYPAFYSTSFSPALVLKGSFGLSPRGRRVRTALISLQYVISFILIICAVFVRVQNDYIRSFPIGLSKENVLTLPVTEDVYTKRDVLSNELKRNMNILDLAFSNGQVVAENKSSWGAIKHKDREVRFYVQNVTEDFLSTLGIEISEGRGFIPEDKQKRGTFIFNETARREFGFELNDELNVHGWRMVPIVGFAKDFNFKPLHYGVQPIGLMLNRHGEVNDPYTAYIRVNMNDLPATIEHIRETVAGMGTVSKDHIQVEFLDQSLEKLYKSDTKISNLITLFSFLAILISLIGVFGLILFESQYRRKEIGIRKVHGATIAQILMLLNQGFIKIVLVCFVIAVPVSYFAMRKWLEGFAYKSAIHFWIFGVALLAILVITGLTVTLQSYRAATENPINSIKTE